MYMLANQLVPQLREGLISSVELLQEQLRMVNKYNPKINAVVTLDVDAALKKAAEADRKVRNGEPVGRLHGLPITVKEAFNVTGLPTTWGYPAHKNNIAQENAPAVQRLVDAGAIIYGKTNVPVACSDWQTFNPVYGTTNNPWDLERIPGGSSGGSAAALAAGFTALELGSDIGASIRNPAHYCGVYGHKTTWGVIPLEGHELPGTVCMDTLDIAVSGPLARSAKDLQLALDVLTEPLESFGALGWQSTRWRDHGKRAQDFKVAILTTDAQAPVDYEIQEKLHDLAAFLRKHGVSVAMDVRPADTELSRTTYYHLLRAATGAWMDDEAFAKADEIARSLDIADMSYRACNYRGSTMTHRDWQGHNQNRALLNRQWRAFFQEYDVLICPIATSVAFKHNQGGERWERMIEVNGQQQDSTTGLFWAGYSGMIGLPATAVPIGRSKIGLPIGAQIVGPVLSDPACIRFATWLEDEWLGFEAPPMKF